MRKTQLALIKKAKSAKLCNEAIDVMSREDIKIDYIKHVFAYVKMQKDNYHHDESDVAREAKKILDFLIQKRNNGYIKTDDEFSQFINELLPIVENDYLIGNDNKFYLYRAYKFSISRPTDMTIRSYAVCAGKNLYNDYKYLLNIGTTHKIAIRLVKSWAQNYKQDPHWWHQSIYSLLKMHDCLRDDLVHNAEGSLLYYIMLRDICGDFSPNALALKRLYDEKNHRFKFDISEFDDYFTSFDPGGTNWGVDETRIAQREAPKYPLLTYIDSFRKKHNMEAVYNGQQNRDMFHKEQLISLENPMKVGIYKKCYSQIQSTFTVNDAAHIFSISITNGLFVSVDYQEFRKIEVSKNNVESRGWSPCYDSASRHISIFISPDGKIFEVFNNGKRRIPMPMRHLLGYAYETTIFGEFINYLLDYYQKENRFVTDVINDCKDRICILPITFNDIWACKNKTHFLHTKYKASVDMKTNWNKKNINLSYMIIKAYPKVDGEIGKRILLQQNDVNLVPIYYNQEESLNDKVSRFLANVISQHVAEIEKKNAAKKIKDTKTECKEELREVATGILDDEWEPFENSRIHDSLDLKEIEREIYDYVRMCSISKSKVKVDIKSLRQAINLHDDLAHREHDSYYRRNTQAVNVPKNTKFKKLREILPQEFEWIQTRKRLILETELQHHCVWSYASKISADKCAIYSFVDSDGKFGENGEAKRYTIEFMLNQDNKTYQIIQVQGKYDRAHTENMRKYIQTILDENQKEQTKP